mgnify:CR=1 FL=1
MIKSKDIDTYIAAQPERIADALERLRSFVWAAVPTVVELMNYNIPAFALIEGGKRDQQIMMAGYKNHIGFYPHPDTILAFKSHVAGFKYAKGSVQFPLGQPLPEILIVDMIQYRYKKVLAMKSD